MLMSNIKNVPQIRFIGFTDAWEQRKLIELGEIVTGSTPSTQHSEYYSDDGIAWVTPTDISENITFQTSKKLSKEGEKIARIVPKNTILVTCIASIGKNTMLGTTGSFNQQINGLVPNLLEFDPYFLFTESNLWSTKMQSIAAQGTMQIINKTGFSEMNTYVPTLSEQQQIGTYFRNLDTLITLHQRKCDTLSKLKKSMLQKMFSKNGESVPEFRFEGFTDAWEQRKLGEVSDKITKKNQDMVLDEVFTNSAEHGIISQRDYFDKDIASSESINGYYVVEPNDFVYNPRISNLAPFGPVKRNKLNKSGVMSPLYYIFRVRNVDYGYLEYFFSTNRWHSFMHLNGNSGARADRFAIRDEVFTEMPIDMPQDIVEQKVIGDYFRNLDNLITLHQRKLETLKKLKKSMLQKMFV